MEICKLCFINESLLSVLIVNNLTVELFHVILEILE